MGRKSPCPLSECAACYLTSTAHSIGPSLLPAPSPAGLTPTGRDTAAAVLVTCRLFHPVYEREYLEGIRPTHKPPAKVLLPWPAGLLIRCSGLRAVAIAPLSRGGQVAAWDQERFRIGEQLALSCSNAPLVPPATTAPHGQAREKVALVAVRLLRWGFDAASGYGPGMSERQWLRRILFLETIAGVPGMVAGG